MKRTLSFIIILAVIMTSAFVIPTATHQNDCMAKSKSKYVKVKRTTYNKYKAAYNKEKDYKLTISEQKATISELKLEVNDLNSTIKNKKQTISWLWSTLEENGFYYNYDTHKWEQKDSSYNNSSEEPDVEEDTDEDYYDNTEGEETDEESI